MSKFLFKLREVECTAQSRFNVATSEGRKTIEATANRHQSSNDSTTLVMIVMMAPLLSSLHHARFKLMHQCKLVQKLVSSTKNLHIYII